MTQEIKHSVADPAGLGLFGLAIVTLVASSEKFGWTSGLSLVLPWAIFLGCAAQLIACICDFKRQNVFGATAFGAFSMFWLAVGMTWLIKLGALGPALASSADSHQLGVALIGYFIFTAFMTLAAVETTRLLFIILVVIDGLFAFLIMNAFGIYPQLAMTLAGIAEFAIALLSFYGSAAAVLNLQFGRVFLPVGAPFGIFKSAPVAVAPVMPELGSGTLQRDEELFRLRQEVASVIERMKQAESLLGVQQRVAAGLGSSPDA